MTPLRLRIQLIVDPMEKASEAKRIANSSPALLV